MIRIASFSAALLATLFAAQAAWAQATPAGLWRTIDDDGKTEKSQVRIVDNGGTVTGKIEKIADPSKQDAKCEKCSGALKDQPIVGMQIIEGMKKSADDAHWEGGTILDPNNGKTYKLRLTPLDGGKGLEVRGYIGPFYRNQHWQRIE
jgi:uncharacterized protein (DUF2147 family)